MAHPNSKKAKAAKARRAEERRQRHDPADGKSTEQRRIDEREASRARHVRRQRIKQWRNRAGAFLALSAVLIGLGFALQPDPEIPGVTKVPNDGRGHVSNARFASASPTSGAHSLSYPTVCGAQSTELDAPLAVHALEHGVVVIWYSADRPELGDQLASMVNKWPSHVIAAPNPRLTSPVVATAWNRLKNYQGADPEIADFIRLYRNRGPEDVGCDIS